MRDQYRHMDRGNAEPNIARAIQRSRDARAAIRRRRRRNFALTAILSVALAGAGTFAVGGLTGNDMVRAAVSQTKSLAELLDMRSPGNRTEAQLTKTKHARALARQRMAPRTRLPVSPPGPAKDRLPGLAELLAAPGPVATVEAMRSFPPVAIGSPPSLGAIVGPSPGLDVTSPGGGGGGVPPVTQPTTPREIIPTSPLPEPGTWATMLLGFALIGWRVKRAPGARMASLLY